MANYLKIIIPYNQTGSHRVNVSGPFDPTWGVEVHTANPYDAEIARVYDLTIEKHFFNFHCFSLNKTGYEFYLKFREGLPDPTGYSVNDASDVTKFEIVSRPD